ncbi:MAG: C40 family peptidase [Firmicutes bacterium]|nr:C40 family peptidase [Bacillota bacterium]
MENSRHALIGEGILPLFGKPSPHQVVIDEGLYGMDCVILEEKDDYALIRMEYGYEGWVLKRGLCEGTWPSYLEKVRVGKRQIDVLAKTEVASEILKTMPLGSVLTMAEDAYNRNLKEGWSCVRLADGSLGYTKSSYLMGYLPISFGKPETPEAAFRQGVCMTARLYEGTHYRWGGKSPQGIDCSGLCSMAYLICGSAIYRDAAIKEGFGMHEIVPSRMKPGDLLFFKGHVAMYLGGDRRLYIHSTAKAGSDGVDYNSLVPGDPLYRQDLAEGILQVGSLF